MRKRLLALAAAVGLLIGGSALVMQPAAAADCDGANSDNAGFPAHPSGHGNEIVGLYVETTVATSILGEGAVPVIGTPESVYVEVQDDGEYTPVSVEAGYGHADDDLRRLTYTCSDVILEFVEDQLP